MSGSDGHSPAAMAIRHLPQLVPASHPTEHAEPSGGGDGDGGGGGDGEGGGGEPVGGGDGEGWGMGDVGFMHVL